MGKLIDITGKRFGKLVVLDLHPNRDGQGKPTWLCQCDCGNKTLSAGSNLRVGLSTSCGCSRAESLTTHGASNGASKLYQVWQGMKQRCSNPDHVGYRHYGGRGVIVCEEWGGSYEAFRDWANANGYAAGLTLDRENNDGDYEPSNCRWATWTVQNNNKRNSKRRAPNDATV